MAAFAPVFNDAAAQSPNVLRERLCEAYETAGSFTALWRDSYDRWRTLEAGVPKPVHWYKGDEMSPWEIDAEAHMARLGIIHGHFMESFWGAADELAQAQHPNTVRELIALTEKAYLRAYDAHGAALAEHNVEAFINVDSFSRKLGTFGVNYNARDLAEEPLAGRAELADMFRPNPDPEVRYDDGLFVSVKFFHRDPALSLFVITLYPVMKESGQYLAVDLDGSLDQLFGNPEGGISVSGRPLPLSWSSAQTHEEQLAKTKGLDTFITEKWGEGVHERLQQARPVSLMQLGCH